MINVNVGGPIQADCRYKTKVLKGNLSFESQVTDVNTKYIVKWDFSLNQDVTMPEHCIIEFDGGSINGNSHIIYGVDTVMIYNQPLSEILPDVYLEGTWMSFCYVRILENGIIAVYNGVKFVEADGAEAGVKRNGTSDQRPSPTQIYTGFQYFDTTLGHAIWLNDNGDWVDATGSIVNE